MLRRFLYLDTATLSQYISTLEGGLSDEESRRTTSTGTGGGSVDLKVVGANGSKTSENETSRTVTDTPEARFERLLTAGARDPEGLGWEEISQPDLDFPALTVGAMVSWEADFYVPETVKLMSKSGGALDAIRAAQTIMPMAANLGIDTSEMPDSESLGAMAGFLGGLDADLIIVGERDETEWKVAGKMSGAFVRGEIDGPARIVGKVTRFVGENSWQSLLTFPGLNLVSRKQRREMAAKKPEPGQEDNFLEGPAVMLDILAIYS